MMKQEMTTDLERERLRMGQGRTPTWILKEPSKSSFKMPVLALSVADTTPTVTTTTMLGIAMRRSMETSIAGTSHTVRIERKAQCLQQGESTTFAIGVRLRSFKGDGIRSAQSVLGPGNEEMIHVNTCLLTREDHDADIKFAIANFGHNPCTVKQGDYIAQLIMLGVDEVVVEFIALEDKAHEIMAPNDAEDDDVIHQTQLGELGNAIAAPTITTNNPWGEYQKHGGPETTKLYDPDAITPEPSGVLQPFASRILMNILYAARMCRCDLLQVVCGLASCATKWTHQCDRDLRRLICYIDATKDHAMIGWCGDPSSALELRV
jgi:dUTPase